MNQAVLKHLPPEQVEVEIWRADELEVCRGLSSELDEMWSFVQAKAHPRESAKYRGTPLSDTRRGATLSA